MAKLMLIGKVGRKVEITRDPLDAAAASCAVCSMMRPDRATGVTGLKRTTI